MIVRFASLCDVVRADGLACTARSAEYTEWPTCTDCMHHFCPQHGAVTIEADEDQSEQGLCQACQDDHRG